MLIIVCFWDLQSAKICTDEHWLVLTYAFDLDCCRTGILWMRRIWNGNTSLYVFSIAAYEVWGHLLWKLGRCKRCSTLSENQNEYCMRKCTFGSAFPESCSYWQVASVLFLWMQPSSWEMLMLGWLTSPVRVDGSSKQRAAFCFRNRSVLSGKAGFLLCKLYLHLLSSPVIFC